MKRLLLPLLCFFLLSYVSSATVIEVPEAVGGMLIDSGAAGGNVHVIVLSNDSTPTEQDMNDANSGIGVNRR